jgi:hypothetical protein
MAQAQSKSIRDKTGASGSASRRGETAYESRTRPNLDGHQLDMARRMGAAMFDGFARMNREFLHFVSTRFTEDMKAVRSFADCRHPSEFVEAELRFMQNLVRHYAENTNRMLGIAANVAGHNLDDVEDVLTDTRSHGTARPQRSAA